jgi:hypothetical protein
MLAFSVLSLVCIAYGMVPWQPARDRWLIVLQVLLSVLLAVAFKNEVSTDFNLLLVVLLAGPIFACCSLLFRIACWKQEPLITLFLVAGSLLLLILHPVYYFFLQGTKESFRLVFFYPAPTFELFILGFLVLIQREHVKRKAQENQPLP